MLALFRRRPAPPPSFPPSASGAADEDDALSSREWPEGLLVRYVNQVGGHVDVTAYNPKRGTTTWDCAGCGDHGVRDWSPAETRRKANEHADKCRAVNRPKGVVTP